MRLEAGQRREGKHLSLVVSNVILAEVPGVSSVRAGSLDIHLPLSPEPVEIVNKISAHESLDGLIDVRDRDAELQRLIAVHVNKLLRHTGQKRGVDAGNLRAFAGGGDELINVGGKIRNVMPAPVLKDQREAA